MLHKEIKTYLRGSSIFYSKMVILLCRLTLLIGHLLARDMIIMYQIRKKTKSTKKSKKEQNNKKKERQIHAELHNRTDSEFVTEI